MEKIGKNPKIWQIWRPVAPQPYIVQKSRPRTPKLPGPLTTTWNKQYLSAVHHVICSLLWVRCLFDRHRQIIDFPIFRFRHPDYYLDRAQKLISSSMSRHLSTRKMLSKSMHVFLSNLANRQTDRQADKHRGQSHIPPPSSEVIITDEQNQCVKAP